MPLTFRHRGFFRCFFRWREQHQKHYAYLSSQFGPIASNSRNQNINPAVFSKMNHRFTVVSLFVCFSYFPIFRAKKVRAVRQEKMAEYHVTERLSLATPLTSVLWAPLEQFATILPRILYNSVMAARGCQWLLLVKVTRPITQAVTVWIF